MLDLRAAQKKHHDARHQQDDHHGHVLLQQQHKAKRTHDEQHREHALCQVLHGLRPAGHEPCHVNDKRKFCKFGRLERKARARDTEPALRAVAAHAKAGDEHEQHQKKRTHEREHADFIKKVVIHPGNHVHRHEPDREVHRLTFQVKEAVVPGCCRVLRIIVACGKKHHKSESAKQSNSSSSASIPTVRPAA